MLLPFNPEQHTKLIAELHYKALRWTTNSQLGENHILKIYQGLAALPSTFGFVWMYEGQMIGFALGSMNYKEARAKIKSAFGLKDIFSVIIKSFGKPLHFINAFETVFLIPFYLKRCGTKAEWIAWITDKSHNKHGIAAIQCYYALKKYYSLLGVSTFIAQGEKRSKESEAYLDNDKSIKKKSFFQNHIYIIDSAVKK